jgi:DMSO/TMAO reductase YedYZ molybdopterin-dependent catalytic subunit
LEETVELAGWRLKIRDSDIALKMEELQTLSEVTQITPLNCIEGWTTVARWTGIRMADFVDKFYPVGRKYAYVGLTTPDEKYYVGLDAASAFHPQTLLCYAINEKPLSAEHGAPLRLLIPTKYGIKNLKCIGTISFTNERPKDYWAEQGYDWFAGF